MPAKKKVKGKIDLGLLNSGQKDAFTELCNFLTSSNDSVYVLKGWAGTGKTYTISMLVSYVLNTIQEKNKWYKIAVTGPTNKSVRVIRKSTGLSDSRVIFQTIHKLLGLTEKITADGKQEFVPNENTIPKINSVKLLIIDEVSMLNDDLFHEILKFRDKVKIICMGDPSQIPPVGKPDCIPFTDELADAYGIKTLVLSEVMRQKAGNYIIDASLEIRKNIGSSKSPVDPITVLNESGEGIEFLNLSDPNVRAGFSEILGGYLRSNDFRSNPEFVKIIAWRNKTVASMNDLCRKIIYGPEDSRSKILIGEKLIANSAVVQDSSVVLNTNEEFTVERFEIKIDKISIKISDDPISGHLKSELKYYDTSIVYYDDSDNRNRIRIEIIHEDSETEFKKILNLLKLKAIEKKGADKSWIKYYDFMRRYADVIYGYSITCHKSQGSTYTNAFVLEDDIDMNLNVVERNRIKYTAYTRASKKLYVLKRF
jgi:exodeoxyribonuclease-5